MEKCCSNTCGCPKKAQGQCGGCQGKGCPILQKKIDVSGLTSEEECMITLLEELCYLPIGKVVGCSFAPIYIRDYSQSIEETMGMTKVLLLLEGRGIVTLDWEVPLYNYQYEKEFAIECLKQFCEIQKGTPFTSLSKKGSVALSTQYLSMVDSSYEERISSGE
ncbi:MAG: hypothetical protein R3Y54_05700 [Eubacteriales bacterium]